MDPLANSASEIQQHIVITSDNDDTYEAVYEAVDSVIYDSRGDFDESDLTECPAYGMHDYLQLQ